jgi:hypothetical protein
MIQSGRYVGSLVISVVIAVLSLSGYCTLVLFLGLTEVPIVIRSTDEHIESCLSNNMKNDEYSDFGAFNSYVVTLVNCLPSLHHFFPLTDRVVFFAAIKCYFHYYAFSKLFE